MENVFKWVRTIGTRNFVTNDNKFEQKVLRYVIKYAEYDDMK
jgi:hypothetical protein